MKFRLRLNRNIVIFGGAAAWGLLLISCVTVNRTMLPLAYISMQHRL